MTRLTHTTSRLALIAMLSAAPLAVFAQSQTDADVTAETGVTTETTVEVPGAPDAAASADTAATADSETAVKPAPDAASSDTAATADSETAVKPAPDAAASSDTAATGSMTADSPAATEDGTGTAQAVEGQIVLQSENTVLAEDLIGSNVFSNDGEVIGDVEDLIVSFDGAVEGIVIGVGGFLGIGEKPVAIAMTSLTARTDENGHTRLYTSATRADLEAAAEFVTADEQKAAEKLRQSMQQNQPSVPASN